MERELDIEDVFVVEDVFLSCISHSGGREKVVVYSYGHHPLSYPSEKVIVYVYQCMYVCTMCICVCV